jgi:NADH:ubiquinone oxidoreductase subunit F (NADH-binding)/NADH:ubiquinone oxidoreductase subunit E
MDIDINQIKEIIEKTGSEKDAVIPILQSIQNTYNYIPQPAIESVCDLTDITPADIIGVASFYSQFRLEPVGDHVIKVCVGTACHVKGAGLVYDAFHRELGLHDKQKTQDSGKYTLDKVSCLGCCTLAPVVQVDDITYGHVAPNQVAEVIRDFETKGNKKSGGKFRKPSGQEIKGEIRVGLGSCCVASGSNEVRKAIDEVVNRNNINVKVKHVGCVGMCHNVPLVELVPYDKETKLFAKVKPEDVKSIIEDEFKPDGFLNRLKAGFFNQIETIQSDANWSGIERYSIDIREKRVSSFLGNQLPIATEHRGEIDPLNFEEYLKENGFDGLKKALKLTPQEVIEQVKTSEIRGRGGGGFPTGLKWEGVAKENSEQKYLICNGDEGDPGAFMDRMLLESYPFRIIEGILIGAYAVGATEGILYIRAEYPLAVARINQAIKICRDRNLLGENILDSGFNFDVRIYQGAGAFVCGEETALIASVEGKRGFPRIRPPFPSVSGLNKKPTLVNNTETFAQLPYIIRHGAENFSNIGTDNSKGTKVFALAGKINRGGLIEVPMGITIREVVDVIGGGVANGKKFKAIQIGGPSGGCIPHWMADTPIDFNSLNNVGAMMGSGGMVVLDETDCMVDIARYFLSFTQDESCGKCTFCRLGTKRMMDILDRICAGKGKSEDLGELEKLAKSVQTGSLCGLGRTAPNPILSTLKYFRDEYEAHINGVCPTGKCKEIISYSVNDNCIGCTICAQRCPVDAIAFTPHEKHNIDLEKCIKCDTCKQVCPEDAIDVK